MIEMELIPGGQIKRLHKREKPITDEEASLVMKSLLEGVEYIHSKNIIHRDLKPENILLASGSDTCTDIKIVDFGLSAVLSTNLIDTNASHQNCKAGTLIYMAPEQVTKQSYAKKVDLWACGIVMYQLLSQGLHPCYTKGDSVNEYIQKLENFDKQPIVFTYPETGFSQLAVDFFEKLCSYPQIKRYSA